VDWGDIPSWLSSVATVGALLFAAVAAVAAQRVYRIESERDRVNAEQRKEQEAYLRRTQAALVSAWWGHDAGGGWGAFVRNASETPVYQASLTVLDVHDPDVHERVDLPVIPPAGEPMFRPTGLADDGGGAADYRVEITFTDSAGARWIRDQQGRLSELRPEVVIWADERRARALRGFASEFLATHGVKVRFRTGRIEALRAALLGAAGSDETPDILVGPHDWLGGLVRAGAIEPLALSPRRRQGFLPEAVAAMTYQGELYGVPYALDTAVLLRHTGLAPDQPATFEELLATGQALRADGRADEVLAMQVGPDGDAYYMYPILVGAGGRLFDRNRGGVLDTGAPAVDAPETVAAFERFRGLGARGVGVLRREVDRERATELFAAGRTPYLICASRVFADLARAGLPFDVGPVPPFEGFGAVRPFSSVHGFFLTRQGPNKSIAQDLAVHYLTRTEVALALYEAQPRPPALRVALEQVVDTDSRIAAFAAECRNGDLMPSVPEMPEVWRLLGRAEADLVAGADTAPTVRQLAQGLRAALGARRSAPLPRAGV
jgi:arabinogalactan oligomer/maltooligosaccharide transport system substrate-binding protein